MNTPGVTVLMTVYNAEKYLDASVRCILEQTFTDFEFLIIDDASTDNSLAILQAWANRDSRIRIALNPENKGQTASLNSGLAQARGRWIARQDADDLADATKLARQWQWVQAYPECRLVGTNGWIIDETNRLTGSVDAPCFSEGIDWAMPWINPFLHASVLFDRALALELGGYDLQFRICQDYDLWARMLPHARPVNLPERLLFYRHYGASLSKASADRAETEAAMIAHREFRSRFAEDPSPLADGLRRGVAAADRSPFWRYYTSHLRHFLERRQLAEDHPGIRDACMRHHLKVAGSSPGVTAKLQEIGQALLLAPGPCLGWLSQRLRPPKDLPG